MFDKAEVEENDGAAAVVVNNKNEIIDILAPKTLNLHKPSVMVNKTQERFSFKSDIIDAN